MCDCTSRLSRALALLGGTCSRLAVLRAPAPAQARAFSIDFEPIPEPPLNPLFETAQSALEKSCYLKINWKCSEDDLVIDAVKRMVAHDIGALAVTSKGDDAVAGIFSERDYLKKVAFLNKDPTTTKVGEVATMGGFANLVTVTRMNPIDRCMVRRALLLNWR